MRVGHLLRRSRLIRRFNPHRFSVSPSHAAWRHHGGATSSGLQVVEWEETNGAGYGDRTRLTGLGSQGITTMLSPRCCFILPAPHACNQRTRTPLPKAPGVTV